MSKLDEYKQALKHIEESPRDRIGILGEIGIVGIGITGGIASAGTVAATAGASTILGSTTLGSLLGGIFVATTPVGWVIGTAAVGGVAAYSIAQLFKSGNVSDERTIQNIHKLKETISKLEKETIKYNNIDDKYANLASMYLKLIDANLIDETTVKEVLEGIKAGNINIELAFKNVQQMLTENNKME